MKRIFLGMVIGAFIATAMLVSVAVLAQDGIAAFVRPLIVDVRQVVPVVADVIVPLEDGTTITATVPLTLNVALQVSLSGVVSNSVEVVEETEPEVTISEPTPTISSDEPVIEGVHWTVAEVEHLAPEMDLGIHVNFETLGEFLLLHFELENTGRQPIGIDYGYDGDLRIELVDEQGRVC